MINLGRNYYQMTITIELLFAICMFNNEAKYYQACKSIANASYLQYKQELSQLDKIERDISAKIPPDVVMTVNVINALQSGNIYIPLINKEF